MIFKSFLLTKNDLKIMIKIDSIEKFEALIEAGVELTHSEMQHYLKLKKSQLWRRRHPHGKERIPYMEYLTNIKTLVDTLIDMCEEEEQKQKSKTKKKSEK